MPSPDRDADGEGGEGRCSLIDAPLLSVCFIMPTLLPILIPLPQEDMVTHSQIGIGRHLV
jgi:hypothetical protein